MLVGDNENMDLSTKISSSQDLKAIVADEIIRAQTQGLLEREVSAKGKGIGAILRHPVLVSILGFFLTTGVGTIISQSIADRAQRDSERLSALDATEQFALLASQLRVLQRETLETIERQEDLNLLEIVKQKYDRAYLEWESNLYANFLSLRTFFGFAQTTFIEQSISRTIHQDFKIMYDCIDAAFAEKMKLGAQGLSIDPRGMVNECLNDNGKNGAHEKDGDYIDAFDLLQERMFQCSRYNFDVLHLYVDRDLHCGTDSWKIPENGDQVIEGVYNNNIKNCHATPEKDYVSFKDKFGTYCSKKSSDFLSYGIFE